jgi:hypothetical protein
VCCGSDPEPHGHYKLLASLAEQAVRHGTFLAADIGTGFGTSAIALASAPGMEVISFDVRDLVQRSCDLAGENKTRMLDALGGRATFHVNEQPMHWLQPEHLKRVCAAALVVLDVPPHRTELHAGLLSALRSTSCGFGGLLLVARIRHPVLRGWWKALEHHPGLADVSDLSFPGAAGGLGAIAFGRSALVRTTDRTATPNPTATGGADLCAAHGWSVRDAPAVVYDAVMFHHELDLLELRLLELNETVGRWTACPCACCARSSGGRGLFACAYTYSFALSYCRRLASCRFLHRRRRDAHVRQRPLAQAPLVSRAPSQVLRALQQPTRAFPSAIDPPLY